MVVDLWLFVCGCLFVFVCLFVVVCLWLLICGCLFVVLVCVLVDSFVSCFYVVSRSFVDTTDFHATKGPGPKEEE